MRFPWFLFDIVIGMQFSKIHYKESNSELDSQHEDTLEEWNNFLNKLDDLLSPLGLSFEVYRDEETGKRYRTLVRIRN